MSNAPSSNSRALRIAVREHRGHSRRLARALFRAGHRAARGDAADVLLVDLDPPPMADRFDVPVFSHRPVIDHYAASGAKVVMYEHGINPSPYYDGLFEPYERVDIRLVPALGYAEFLRRVECPGAVRVVGWSLCEQRPFSPRREVRRVLFAPLHPGGSGDTPHEPSTQANAAVYERLLAMPWQLTVRMVGRPEHNGIWPADGVDFVPGGLDLGLVDIHAADVVVAGAGTFSSLAIARGVPTLVYAMGKQARYGLPDEPQAPLSRPERYLDYIRYPFDPLDGPLDEVVHAAARSEEPIVTWKRRFIGEPFDEAAAVEAIERTARDTPTIDARGYTVAAFADELLERPELLVSYAASLEPGDDATLLLWAPGVDEAAVAALAREAGRAAGLDEGQLPRIVPLAHTDSLATDALLAERADAVLSDWPAFGRLGTLPRLSFRSTASRPA